MVESPVNHSGGKPQLWKMETMWVKGYTPQKVLFVNNNTICYPCGNFLIFMDINTKKEKVLQCENGSIGVFTTNSTKSIVAFAEQRLKPFINLYSFPELTKTSVLTDGAELDYVLLEFSYSGFYFASFSSLPEFNLTIWNWKANVRLCSESVVGLQPTILSFNPVNQLQLCLASEERLLLWNIERCDDFHLLKRIDVKLPAEDGTPVGSEDVGIGPDSSALTYYGPKMLISAQAGLVGDLANTFVPRELKKTLVQPISVCWTPISDLYVGCKTGQLLLVDAELHRAVVLATPFNEQLSTGSLRNMSSNVTMSVYPELKPCAVKTLALNKKGLYSAGSNGILFCIEVTPHKVEIEECFSVGMPIRNIAFSVDFESLLVATEKGSMHIYKPSEPDKVTTILDIDSGDYVSAALLGTGKQYCVDPLPPRDSPPGRVMIPAVHATFTPTVVATTATSAPKDTTHLDTEDSFADITSASSDVTTENQTETAPSSRSARTLGAVQVWSVADGKLISTLILPVKIKVMASCPSSNYVALGTETGHIYFINLAKVETPHLVYQIHLHNISIQCLEYDHGGQYLLAGCSDGHMFILNAKPSKQFKVLGYTEIKDEIMGCSLAFHMSKKIVNCLILASQTGDDKSHGATWLTRFDLLGDLAASSTSVDHRGKMNDVAIRKQDCQAELPLTSVILNTDHHVYGYCTLTRTIYKYKITRGSSNDTFNLITQAKVEGHQLGPGFLYLSANQQYLVSVARDGYIQLRDANNLGTHLETQCHSYRLGGVKSITLSLDCQTVLTTGVHDGTMVCNTERFDPAGSERNKVVLDYNHSIISMLDQSCVAEDKVLAVLEQQKEGTKDKLDVLVDISHLSPGASTHSASSFNTTSTSSSKSYQRLDDSRFPESTWLETKMAEAVEKDNRKHAEAKAKLKQGIKKLRATIKRMMLENENVPEIERLEHHEFNLDLKEQKRLHSEGEEKVAKVRETIEMENLANQYLREVIKRECWDNMSVKGRTLEAFSSGLAVTNYPMRERNSGELELLKKVMQQRTIELIDLKARKDIVETPPKKEEKEDEEAEDEESKEEESTALKGSLTSEYGVVNPYLYKQLELHTKDEKINQIILLQDVIYNIKTAFNKEFDATYKQKEVEMARVKDRTMRILEIMQQLDMDEEVWLPTMSNKELPEREFEVQDSEITAERYLTPEQKRKLEEEYKAEQLRLLAAKADNWRERALKDMMGGVLETKKSDILKMEIPVPYFMDKPEFEWTEEQIKQAKEYAIKEQELNEEKDKYRKTLESELKKLQSSVAESRSNFDDIMNKLFEKKVRTEMIIYQEELKICNLVFSLRIEEEIQNRNAQINYILEEQKDFMAVKSQMTQNMKVMVDRFRESYDDLVAEDRLLDRGFRKEFSDVSATMVDQLYKLYKRRPKVQLQRIQVATANPFEDQSQSVDDNHVSFLAAMVDLDSLDSKPENLDPAVWNRFCESRKKKIESENQVRLKAVTLAEMQMFLQRRMEEDENNGQQINNLIQELNNLREIKSQFQLNLMVQLVLKQGQVEVTSSDFIPDYSNSIFLHKGGVEDLNSTIQLLGEKKVASMVERKDFRKKIVQVEWECQKMLMQMDDLHNKIRDILKFKISKQAQMYLREANYDSQINADIMGMERSVQGQEKFHSKVLKKKQEAIKELEKQIAQLKKEMKVMDRQLKEQHISVSERQNIQEMITPVESEKDTRNRFRDLMQHNRLTELSRSQAEDIAILRSELERQRMKSFPILAETEQYSYA
ncbi:cilia- and flagella-associated protein 43 [Hemiscyllium ocellatum]|uniref:cilia- and flagella-associated protein 43 n=1 Tax=Hemiscyllium ocellatum TaxID=170820 RepID=UPI002966FD3D|nr:cilia- and flagella-associated protein 43 [Hemiscyllium ocellatum]